MHHRKTMLFIISVHLHSTITGDQFGCVSRLWKKHPYTGMTKLSATSFLIISWPAANTATIEHRTRMLGTNCGAVALSYADICCSDYLQISWKMLNDYYTCTWMEVIVLYTVICTIGQLRDKYELNQWIDFQIQSILDFNPCYLNTMNRLVQEKSSGKYSIIV